MEGLPDDALVHVAAYFQALSEPTRLRVLNLLRERPHGVGELAQRCGFSAANISRHLSLLMQHGLVARESRGTAVIYRIADPSVYALCDLVCGNIARQLDRVAAGRAAFAAGAGVDRRATDPAPASAQASAQAPAAAGAVSVASDASVALPAAVAPSTVPASVDAVDAAGATARAAGATPKPPSRRAARRASGGT